MATTTSFKQQCPSCEASVPIRDANLVGRKIDCPKCKYRFVVEDPGASDEAEDEAPKKRRGEEEDSKRNGKAAKAKGRPTRDDEDDDETPAKKGGGSTKLMLGVGLAVVAVGILAAVGYYFMSDSGSSKTTPQANRSTPPQTAQATANSTTPATGSQAAADEKSGENKIGESSMTPELATNLLPPRTEGVCLLRMQDLLTTAIGRSGRRRCAR